METYPTSNRICVRTYTAHSIGYGVFPITGTRENNPFPKEKQFSGLFFLDANIANALCFNILKYLCLFRKKLLLLVFGSKDKKCF